MFIRSVASRGTTGGLARATRRIVDLLDAAGFDVIVVETVGAGQSEVDVAALADTVVVVCPPGLGDGVQAIKAGILEIADVLAVSKGDRANLGGAARAGLFFIKNSAPPRVPAPFSSLFFSAAGHSTTRAQRGWVVVFVLT